MSDMPIIDGLLKYIEEKNVSFHMPGHKNNKKNFKELSIIRDNLYNMDNTEVFGLDNLHIPEGMILEAQKKAAACYGAKESFFLVNGSTCGIYSMIMGLTKPKDKIIIQRNCHRSVYMACFLGDLNIVYINPTILEGFDIPVSIDKEEIIDLMDKNLDAKAIVLTCPTYYGTLCDLESIIKEAGKRNIKVLIDEAHGAHLYFNKRLPKGAIQCGADASVVSLHKTTPSLTQTAILNIGENVDSEGIKFMLRAHQSTSPSYVLMASLDSARHIMQEKGEAMLDELIDNIEEFKKKMEGIEGYNIIDASLKGSAGIYDIDATRLTISSKIGGRQLEKILREKYHIQVEMSDTKNIVLICTVGNLREDFERLYNALKEISYLESEKNYDDIDYKFINYKPVMSLRDAYYNKGRKVKLENAQNLISKEMVVPYPPGIPILVPGEIITYDIIEYIKYLRRKGIALNGISDNTAEYIDIVEF
ncbi:arginine decarboxylase [Caloramator quimbayensis]|uniref:Arginine decarboxylase n=2 Tax=Caloramator quimbayensis TaxID=1147123 RepID=A0A1T4WJM7_9CLOT|nr:arginine decarboxylase [Caloramator quimbayensis]